MASCELITIAGADHSVFSSSRDLIITEAARFLSENVVLR
jgi:hypothetical protein